MSNQILRFLISDNIHKFARDINYTRMLARRVQSY